MNTTRFKSNLKKLGRVLSIMLVAGFSTYSQAATLTPLANQPLFAGNVVPGNVLITPSVQFPTPTGHAYGGATFNNANDYYGYFDKNKCYVYQNKYLPGFFNTGVNSKNVALADNTADTNWTYDSTTALLPTTADLGKTYSTGGSDIDSMWIGGSTNTTAGNYTYRTTFNIPSTETPGRVQVRLTITPDDGGLVSVKVGSGLGIFATSTTVPSIAATSNSAAVTVTIPAGTFTSASNRIYVTVKNGSTGRTGLRVDNALVTNIDKEANGSYFVPVSSTSTKECANQWSGNYLNWAMTFTMDPFRSALSGGYRVVDQVGLTVLEKAISPPGQAGSGVKDTPIINNSTLIAKVSPFASTNLYMVNKERNNQVYLSATTSSGVGVSASTSVSGTVSNLMPEQYTPSDNTLIDAAKTYQMYVRVRVCVPGLLEDNCTQYPNGDYKPTGLIQKNAGKLNFGAMGFLNVSDSGDAQYRDGGILAARMGAVGPKRTDVGAIDEDNPSAEWDSATGIFYQNPRPTEATEGGGAADGVVNSGVINYLNKFGQTRKRYMHWDHTSELYYAASRYFRNKGNVPAYSNMNLKGLASGTAYTQAQIISAKDGFPVLTNWGDPIKYSCSANFIIGIGDTNVSYDSNIPGAQNASPTIRGAFENNMPEEATADYIDLSVAANRSSSDKVDGKTSTDYIGDLQGITGTKLGSRILPWISDNSSFYMAGLAYDAHVRDIRQDLSGKQTISTYWLDVLESGDQKNATTNMRNQFYLAAKFGGFRIPESHQPYVSNSIPADSWSKNSTDEPDNYFRANDPRKMIDGLNTAFNNILAEASGASIELPTNNRVLTTGDMIYSTGFSNTNWSGNLSGFTVTTSGDNITKTKVWDARDVIQTQNWDTGRFIATANCTNANNCGVPFRLASLATTDADKLGATTAIKQNILNFIRGDRSNETPAGTLRSRAYVLGDIVDSRIAVVGRPTAPYTDAFNPGYSAFKNATAQTTRQTMVYVGANDGMMHAIQGNSTGGNELFAYVPNALFNGPNGTPVVDGLAALAKAAPDFEHHYYVNATPVSGDVNFGTDVSPNWRTLLVGGLGKGGKAFYALDVTNPSSLNNETNLAAAVKWEFTDPDLGFSYGKPIITKANISGSGVTFNGWVVIVASGYNNANGNGYFFVINAKTGALLKKIPTYATAPTTDAGLAHLSAYIPSGAKYVADAVYGADLLGGLWRLNLSNLTVTKLAELTDAAGNFQAVTVFPIIDVDIATGKRYVFIGTGKMLNETDSPSTTDNTIYAINDGTSIENGFYTDTTLPSGVTFPIQRANLANNTSSFVTTGVTSTVATNMGWYIDLADKFYVDIESESNGGLVTFATNKRTSAICAGGSATDGQGRAYALNFGKGQSAIDTATGYIQTEYLIANAGFFKLGSSSNEPRLMINGSGGQSESRDTNNNNSIKFKLLNWRDLPSASD